MNRQLLLDRVGEDLYRRAWAWAWATAADIGKTVARVNADASWPDDLVTVRYELAVIISAMKALATRALVAAVLPLVVAGCGGDDPPSRAEFVKEANAICTEQRDKLDDKRKEALEGPLDKAEATKFAREQTLPSYQRRVDDIKKLGSPRGDEDKVKAIIDAEQEGIDKSSADLGLLLGRAAFVHANEVERPYGVTQCGSNI